MSIVKLARLVALHVKGATNLGLYSNNKECARFARTLLGGLLHAGCYNLEIVVVGTSVLKFPAVAHAHAC